MAYSRTLEELELAVRREADMVNSAFVSSDEVRAYINESWAQLYDRIVMFDQEYLLRHVDITSTGAGQYDIASLAPTCVVRSISSVVAGGSGYVNGAAVTLGQGSNVSATGIAQVTAGALTGITLTSGGLGYFDIQSAGGAAGFSADGSATWLQNYFTNTPIVVGSFIYSVFNRFGGGVVVPYSGIIKIDSVTHAITWAALDAGDAVGGMTYDDLMNVFVAIRRNGDVLHIDPTTLAVTVVNSVAATVSNFPKNVIIDPLSPQRYRYFSGVSLALADNIYKMDNTGAIVAQTPVAVGDIGASQSLSSVRIHAGTTKLLFAANTDLWEFDTSAPALNLLHTFASNIGGIQYTPTADRTYVSLDSGAALYYDHGAAASVDISASLAAAGITAGPCMPTYNAANDRVWYTSTVPGTKAVAVKSATAAVDISVTTPVLVSVWACEVNGRMVVSSLPDLGAPPFTNTFEYYLYNAGTIGTSPGYVVLNVSGGSGGQIIAYVESDFYKCKGVWYQAGSSGFYNPLRRFQWDEQNLLKQTGIYEASRTLPLYRIASIDGRDKLLIAPDTLGGTYRLWYYPAPPKMISGTDRVDGRAGWDDWIVKDVAIRCLIKEESIEQAASIKAIRDEIWARFQLHAANSDATQPERIRDVRLLSRRYGYWR